MATREQLIEDFADHKLATGEKFERLINSMKTVQEPVEDPAASGTSLSFIDSIEQDKDGKITATKKTLDLSNAHELTPFKGWYKTGDTLPTDGFDGAYLYFKDTSELTGQTTIYRWNGTTYADTGTVVDTSNVQTFETGQAVSGVAIDNSGLANPAANALAKAGDVMQLAAKLGDVSVSDEPGVPTAMGTSGKYIRPDNTEGSISGWQWGLYDVTGCTSVRFVALNFVSSTTPSAGWLFLDASDNIVGWAHYAHTAAATTAEEVVVPVPSGATRFKTNIAGNALTGRFYIYLRKGESVVDRLATKIEVDKVAFVDYSQYAINDPSHYIGSDGLLAQGSRGNAGYTDFIPVADVKGLVCSKPFAVGTGNKPFYGCYVYDANKTPLRNVGVSPAAETSIWYVKPSGDSVQDAYVRFNLGTGAEITELTEEETVTPSDISNYEALKISAGAEVGGVAIFERKTGKNILSPTNIVKKTGLYVSMSNGGLVYSSGSTNVKGVTDFIPMNGNNVVCNSMYIIGLGGWACYDENYHFTHGGQKSYAMFEDGDVFVRFSLNAVEGVQVEYGTVSTDYETYEESIVFKKTMMPEETEALSVTVENITPHIKEPVSDNLCNPAEIEKTGYISGQSGNLVTYTNYAATGFIPIDKQGLYCEMSVVAGNAIGYAYYSDKVASSRIAGYYKNNHPAGCTEKYAAYIENAKYVRFTIPRTATQVMVNKGSASKDYIAYAGYKTVISPEILPESADANKKTVFDDVSIVIPDNVYITQGDQVYLYHKSIIKAADPKCVAIGVSAGDDTREMPRYIKVGGGTLGRRTITLNLYTNDMSSVARKNVNVYTVAKPSSPANNVNILLIGASRMVDGSTLGEMMRRLTGTGGTPAGLELTNIRTVGQRHGSGVYASIEHQAQNGEPIHAIVVAGDKTYDIQLTGDANEYAIGDKYSFTSSGGTWTLKISGSESQDNVIHCKKETGTGTFAQVFSGVTAQNPGTLTRVSGAGSATLQFVGIDEVGTNPFWYNGGIDFEYYASNCITPLVSPEKIDILIISRLSNDFADRTPQQVVADYVTIVDAFHAYNANGKVIINTEPLPSPNGGIGMDDTTYLHPKSTFYGYASMFWKVYELSNEVFSGENYNGFVMLSATNAEFDLENLYPTTTVPTGLRGNKTEVVQNNALHYTTEGKYAVADSLYHCVCKCINDFNAG